MEDISKSRNDGPSLTGIRDWLGVGVRHRRWVALSFLGVLAGVLLYLAVIPPRYASNTKILVKRERADLLVTADPSGAEQQVPAAVTETDLNSEVELIKSQDLLEAVVRKFGLQNASGGSDDPQRALAGAVRNLENALKIEPLAKTSLISITYEDTDPQRSAQVLNTLVDLYMEKHLAVHSPAGTLDFFREQAGQYQQGLRAAESRLSAFSQEEGVVSPEQQKTETLQRLAEFQAELKQTQASIAETEQRISSLQGQTATLSSRMTTQIRTADNPELMEQLKSTLLNLQLKRTELLQKFEPSYRLVQEADTEIKQTQAAIDAADKSKLLDETTDQNPIYEWVNSELVKTHSELAAEQGRAESLSRSIRSYEEKAADLDQKQIVEAGLVRDKNMEEANYVLYQRKQEEARISDALDRNRIVNVAVTQAPEVPAAPSRSRLATLLVGLLAALAVSAGAAVTAEYLSPSLKNSEDVKEFLDLPVLGSVSAMEQ